MFCNDELNAVNFCFTFGKNKYGMTFKINLYSLSFHYFHIILICLYDVIYEAKIALCNI